MSSFEYVYSQIADTETDIQCQTLVLCCQNSVQNILLKGKTFGFQVNIGDSLPQAELSFGLAPSHGCSQQGRY